MKKLLSTYLFSFFAFFVVATIAPVMGGSDAMADCAGTANETACNAATPSTTERAAGYDYCDWVTVAGVQGCHGMNDDIRTDTTFQSDNSFSRTLCNVLGLVTGAGGKAFASFAIISLGIGFFTGKVSWGLMIGVAAGIAAMFGAPTIVAAIAGQDKALDCADVSADGS